MKQRTINITRNIICILGLLALIILIKPTKVCAFSMNDAKKFTGTYKSIQNNKIKK